MANSSLLKSTLHNTIAEGLYNEISQQQSRYYYFLGKTLTWEAETNPPFPTDSFKYELDARTDIITMKQMKPTDVSFVVPRIDWTSGVVYDSYDDDYCTEVIGIDLISGGVNYIDVPKVYIGSTGSVIWRQETSYSVGDMISSNGIYYTVTSSGISGITPPTHTSGIALNGTCSLKYVLVEDGGGTGATATCTISLGKVVEIQLTHRGTGYLSKPTVTIADNSGFSAIANSVVGISATGKTKMEECIFYVINENYNVYVCLDNNGGAPSTIPPSGTSSYPIRYSDNYVWKFIFEVPISLRNKFLTETYIPVTTALKNQFYSGGTIQSIRIENGGTGYTGATILVQGDGYLEENPVYITDIQVESRGAGYTYADVIIDSPVTGSSPWNPETLALSGQYVSHDSNIYKVAISGKTGVTPPSHRYGLANNGQCSLKFVGSKIVATAVISDGEIDDIILYGSVRRVDLVSFGSGYTNSPTVNITDGGGGSNATATAILQNGSVISIDILDPGLNYTESPTVTIGKIWTPSTLFNADEQIYYSNRLYTVTSSGTTSTTPPTHISGSATDGSATLTYAGMPATAVSSIKYGSGYSNTPRVLIRGDGVQALASSSSVKSEAKVIPIISNETMGTLWTSYTEYNLGQYIWYGTNLYQVIASGVTGTVPPTHSSGIVTSGTVTLKYSSKFGSIVGARILEGGVGYSYANVSLNGDGVEASVSADLSVGSVDTQQANIELLTVDGSISSIPVVSGGADYEAATAVIVGDGSGATAKVIVDPVTKRVTKIDIINAGSGYRWAYIVISGNREAYGASARVIISPYGGMGKEAINNLYARTLMFYTNISNDKNQGFVINNDYRQIGVIKNPRKYGEASSLIDPIASACWVISTITDTDIISPDTILNMTVANGAYSPRFRVVTNTGNSILLQSLDNAIPPLNSIFSKPNSEYSFTASSITPPTVDKYSGDLLYIDNRLAFTPSQDQAVTMRTVIRF